MATAPTNPSLEALPSAGVVVPLCPPVRAPSDVPTDRPAHSQEDLQTLLAFLALRERVRLNKSLETCTSGNHRAASCAKLEARNQFTLDEALQLVADRAVAITGADGVAIALADGNEIVLRAAAGTVRPDFGARIDRDSAFSAACLRTAQIARCDDTEVDARANLQACRSLGARSMVAVPLRLRNRAIGVLQAFSAQPFGFDDRDVQALRQLAELVLGALTPEDECRLADSARAASSALEADLPETEPTPTGIVSAGANQDKSIQAALVLVRGLLEDFNPTPDEVAHATTAPRPAEPVLATGRGDKREILASEPDRLNRWLGMLILLVCILITAALAARVWWELKPSLFANRTVPTEEMVPHPAVNAAEQVPVAASAGAEANPASITPGTPSDSSRTSSPSAGARRLSAVPAVTAIQHRTSGDSSTVVVALEDHVQYEAHRLADPDRVYFDLHNTQLASNIPSKAIEVSDALLIRIRVAQPVTGVTRVVLETRAKTDFSVSLEPNPYRLVIELRRIGTSPARAANRFPVTKLEKNRQPIVLPPPTPEDLQLQGRVSKMRIVVDAGHGGRDRGTVGRNGLLEKDLVLEIGQRLGKLLESRLGMDVIYTRRDDSYVPLDERVSIANQARADLFVSVHANYSDLPSARGVETYYTQFFMLPTSKDVDVSPAVGLSRSAVSPSLSSAEMQERVEQSRRLAESVQRSLYGTLSTQNPGLRDRGIKEANFVVLTESAMPGILAEVSFVSSPADEQKLRSDRYREQVAEALYKGIARYAADSHAVKVASAGR